MNGVNVRAGEVAAHGSFLNAVSKLKKTGRVKSLLETSSKEELNLLLKLLLMLVHEKMVCSNEARQILAKKKKRILQLVRSKYKLKRTLASSDLTRMFLKSVAAVLPAAASCYLE